MFSVSANPFNSRARSLYGGWTASPDAQSLDIEKLNAFYGSPDNAATMFRDSRWANIIMRFSKDAQRRMVAKKIKAATHKMLTDWRKNELWKRNYNLAMASVRSPYRRKSLDDLKKAAIVANFESIDAPYDTGELAWMSALSRVPFVANPELPGVTPDGNNMLFSAPDYDISAITDPAVKTLSVLDPTRARYLNAVPKNRLEEALKLSTPELMTWAVKNSIIPP